MSNCVIAEYENTAAAKFGLEVLRKSGFALDQVSVVASADDPAAKHVRNLHADPQSQTASAVEGRGASLGMLIGGTVAAPIAAGTLIGPFIIAGPLAGIAIGAAVGSLVGMESWGVAHDVSADYEARVKSGSVLVIVHDADKLELIHAESSLETTNPKSLKSIRR
ncbi:hypothetical protein FF011L_15750 [Roseimaritima multifibrata]|uniref:DUF1269 domain-containing protein n=1 Tax=Roseimaritima multifibrata TaxID=1930274 RepID=A0A517MDC7_9BACT|nr:hypothetical protein [Roseimaritima multifibrata]QDS92826.1 hypothetical protein FF011L_15750 [Roseimaritima multifibrata]